LKSETESVALKIASISREVSRFNVVAQVAVTALLDPKMKSIGREISLMIGREKNEKSERHLPNCFM